MMAEPKTRTTLVQRGDEWAWGNDEVRTIPARIEDGIYIECDIVHPPSAVGRSLTLRVPTEKVDAMLRAMREHAVEARR